MPPGDVIHCPHHSTSLLAFLPPLRQGSWPLASGASGWGAPGDSRGQLAPCRHRASGGASAWEGGAFLQDCSHFSPAFHTPHFLPHSTLFSLPLLPLPRPLGDLGLPPTLVSPAPSHCSPSSSPPRASSLPASSAPSSSSSRSCWDPSSSSDLKGAHHAPVLFFDRGRSRLCMYIIHAISNR